MAPGIVDPLTTSPSTLPANEHDTVLVVDFGAQYAQLIARRVREAHIYSEIVAHTISAPDVQAKNPKAIILSGGPASVHVEGAPQLAAELYTLGIPVLGICYGAQLIAEQLGGRVALTRKGEYGRTDIVVDGPSTLLQSLPSEHVAWMSHFDAVTELPAGFIGTAHTPEIPFAAFANDTRRIHAVQFHPEVGHSPYGGEVLRRFLFDVAECRPTWTDDNIIDRSIEAIRAQIGPQGRAVCGLSGGVDSAVAAALVHRAIGDRLTCIYVDTGLMRAGETTQIEETFRDAFGIELVTVDAGEQFLSALSDVADPERKRKIIGERFVRIFEAESRARRDARFLVQGTLYPDVIESGSATAAKIKSHHNVGGLPADMDLELVEPLRSLFKDEVRAVGSRLGLPDEIVWRQPFPGPGLGVRIVGTITAERVDIVRRADAIVREEIKTAGLERELWQAFAVLPVVRSVGVMGDERTYSYPIVIRAVTSDDAMTADWARLPYDVLEKISTRITNEVRGVNRVVLDITSKPPGTIEWE